MLAFFKARPNLNLLIAVFMPILWRYLIGYFLRITTACVFAFIAILLTMRLDEIAHFAALGAPLPYLLLFILHQIPYILPIALPLSCLIASLLLIQRLSNSHELTALRASGFALTDILTPIWLTAAFLMLANFWIISEIATHSHLQNNLLKNELRSINPLLLLHNKHLMRLKGFYFHALGDSKVGESCSEVILAIPNEHHQRIDLMIAEQLKASPAVFEGKRMTLITGKGSEKEEEFDQLVIENIGNSFTSVKDFATLLQKKVWIINNDYLQMPLLLARIQEQRQLLQEVESKEEIKLIKKQLNQSYSEITKRLSIAIAVFSFTLMGTSFGITISRKRHYRTLYLAISLTTLYLITFFVAKGLDHQRWLAAALYLLPHLLIISISLWILRRIAKGIES